MPSPLEQAIADAVAVERARCAALARSRKVQSYVPDIGCYTCFEAIAAAIEAGEQPSTKPWPDN